MTTTTPQPTPEGEAVKFETTLEGQLKEAIKAEQNAWSNANYWSLEEERLRRVVEDLSERLAKHQKGEEK